MPTSPDGEGPPAEPPTRSATLEEQVIEARLAVLALPAAERQRLVDAEAERIRFAVEKAAAEATEREAGEEARQAEGARQRALEAAMVARTALQRKLAQERAAAEAVRRDQAQMRGRLTESRRLFETRRKSGSWPGHELPVQVQDVEPYGEAAAALYDRLVDALTETREELRAALVDAETGSTPPIYEADLPALPDDIDPTIRADANALRKSAEDAARAAEVLAAEAKKLTLDVLDATFDHESQLYAARIELLDKLPADKRSAVLGFGREGIAQLRRELSRLVLAARWYRVQRKSVPRRILAAATDIYALAEFVSGFLWLLLLVGAAIYGARRVPRALRAARGAVVRRIRRTSLLRVIQSIIDALEGLSGSLIFLGAVLLAWPALGVAREIGEIQVLHTVVLYFSWYRLALRAAHLGIGRLIRQRLDPDISARLLRSLQIIGRTALVLAIFLSLSERILGKGYLHRLVFGFAWMCALPIAFVLIRWWRGTIADAYLRFRGDGWLADVVRRTREKWYGFFVATAALAILTVVWSIRGVRRFVLGFEQSRKALAFLFRRRLERQAEDLDEPRPGTLPDDLVACLTLAPLGADAPIAVPHFPGLEEALADLDRWRATELVGATLLVGPLGSGKTTWLGRAAQEARDRGLEVLELHFDTRLHGAPELLARLGEVVGAPSRARASLRELAAWLAAGPRRVVILDDAHGLFLRGVGTSTSWDALDDLIGLSGRRVYWLVALADLPFEYIHWARRERGSFRRIAKLGPWPEEMVAKLLHQRTQAAGYRVLYHDLVVDRVAGVESEAQLVSTAGEYARLVWDYSDGCPSVALDCWRSSLVPGGERQVRVHLFRRPDESVLEDLTQVDRFILASVLWHGHLDAAEAAVSLRFPLDRCSEGLGLLADSGVLVVREGRYRPGVPWMPAILRYLRRHHLIEAA